MLAQTHKHFTSETQGRGRRFWFYNKKDARQFFAAKVKAGYRAQFGGENEEGEWTVWSPFAKKQNAHTKAVEQGIDTLALNEWLS